VFDILKLIVIWNLILSGKVFLKKFMIIDKASQYSLSKSKTISFSN